MSDNHRRYSSIRSALSQMFAKEPKGYNAKQLNILAGLIILTMSHYPEHVVKPSE